MLHCYTYVVLVLALLAGVVADVTSWQRQVHALDEHVQRFKAARLRYDYYTKKVDDVRAQAAAAVEKKSKDAAALQDRLQRFVLNDFILELCSTFTDILQRARSQPREHRTRSLHCHCLHNYLNAHTRWHCFCTCRNLIKLDEVRAEYLAASKDCCYNINKAWSER
jgi:hypothetical protein